MPAPARASRAPSGVGLRGSGGAPGSDQTLRSFTATSRSESLPASEASQLVRMLLTEAPEPGWGSPDRLDTLMRRAALTERDRHGGTTQKQQPNPIDPSRRALGPH